MRYSREQLQKAQRHLRRADPVMRELIKAVGPYTLRPMRDRFGLLVRSIISQQISMKAARSIRERLERLVLPARPTAETLLELSTDDLRSVGLSGQKSRYLLDLCQHVVDGRVKLSHIGRRSDEDVIGTLTRVKGIGRWTAQMFLIFGLGRLDVLPHDDLGVRTALRRLYRLDDLPTRSVIDDIARPWRPYASVACWYCWRSFDLESARQKSENDYPV